MVGTFYLGIFVLLAMLGIATTEARNARRATYRASIVLLFAIVGFRFQVGCDWISYARMFNRQGVDGTLETAIAQREPGFFLLSELSLRVGGSLLLVNLAVTAIFFFGLHHLARRQPDPLGFLILSFPVLILNMPMSALRQAAAIGFVFFAIASLIEGRPIRFVIYVLLGAAFHNSAFFMLALTPLWRGVIGRYNLVQIGLFAVFGALIALQSSVVEFYLDRYSKVVIDAIGAPFRLGLLAATGTAFFLFFREKWRRHFPNDYLFVSVGSMMMIISTGLLFVDSIIADRFGYYLNPIQLIIAARIPYLIYNDSYQLLRVTPYLIATLVLIIWTQFSSLFEICYIPYQAWLG